MGDDEMSGDSSGGGCAGESGGSDVRIPGFTIARELGRGAMGVVYLAHEEALGRDVALKVLKPGFGEGDEVRQRFEREVRATARLKHPNIVPILSTGEAGGRRWFAMEFVPGETLDEVLKNSRHATIGVARAARIVRDVAIALGAAHEAGVTHRDVKPGNIMLLTERAPEAERRTTSRRMRRSWLRRDTAGGGVPLVNRPLLADFGLAADRTASKLSESGMLIGTPGYMAPEQYRGRAEDVGPHSDQWALGVVLYECTTGHMPFPTTDLATLARMIGQEEPIPPARLDPRIDRDLETICLTCLAKNPRDRYEDVNALASDLGHWLREEPIAARPPGPLRRIKVWARRKPARATALGALVLAGVIIAVATIGMRTARGTRTRELARAAREHMDRAEFLLAERAYDEWIAQDPSDGVPRDLRLVARARRGVLAASATFDRALDAMRALDEGRDRLARLQARALHGADVVGGSGLGSEDARGSEPWWMREAAYAARREILQLKEDLAGRLAAVRSDLAVARSLAEANAEAAGDEGRSLRDTIRRRAAAWHMGEWRLAIAAGDAERAALHRRAVEELDGATYAKELGGVRNVRIFVPGPSAQGWLFRYEREGDVITRGGPRLLPVPFHPTKGAGPLPAAYAAAVKARLAGEGTRPVRPDVPTLTRPLKSTERIVETLEGAMLRTRYEARLRGSAYPLSTTEANALGRLEGERTLALPPGRYLLLLRRRDAPELRLPLRVARRDPPPLRATDDLHLARVPPDFVLVPGGEVLLGSDNGQAPRALPRQSVPVRTFLAARFELTYADWWAFLDDPRTRAEVDKITTVPGWGLRFVPRAQVPLRRDAQGQTLGGPFETALPARTKDGGFVPMDCPEQPLAHVSLYDVAGYLQPPEGEDEPHDYQLKELDVALRASRTVGWGYLRWRTERSKRRARQASTGGPLLPDVAVVRGKDGRLAYRAMRFALPTQPEWERMARGGDGRRFVYGDEREWLFFKGTRSRPYYTAPEAVGLFAEDESVFGVRDLTGSVAEWTADWDRERGVFWVKGSSWDSPRPGGDAIAARAARTPATAASRVGVRLVVRILDAAE